jgi:hypothetical protein
MSVGAVIDDLLVERTINQQFSKLGVKLFGS